MPGYGPAQVNTWSELCFLLLLLWTTLFLMALATICTIKNNDKHFCMTFYNNWPISCALIGGNLHLIRVQTIEITWWWHNLLFSFSRVKQLVKIFNRNGGQKFRCYCKKQINKNVPWSVFLSTIEMMPKWFHLSFEKYDVISTADYSTEHGKLLLIS